MTAAIDADQVRHVAHLARLKLTDDECAAFGAQLAAILEYVRALDEVNTDGVEPTAHAAEIRNVLRDDAPTAPLGVDRVLANAPESAPPYFKVPKVLDQQAS